MTLLRRLLAGLEHDIRSRRHPDSEGHFPAFDPTLPKGLASYSSDARRQGAPLRGGNTKGV
jgi:hypothetical protein